jgi:hypothetical protein
VPDPADPRSPELEAQLRALDPVEELAYRFVYRQHSRHCRNDGTWRQRLAELQELLDVDQHARALIRAREINASLTAKP